MKPIALAAIICATTAGPAFAFDWTGFYAGLGVGGLNGGYSDDRGDSILYRGATAEGFAGYRIELLMLTLGAEVTASYFLPLDSDGVGLSDDDTTIGKASARATAAMEIGPLLPFVSAGVALAGQKRGGDTVTHPGVVVAAGVDMALTDNLFARVEASYSVFSTAGADDSMGDYLGKLDDQTDIKAGLGWRF